MRKKVIGGKKERNLKQQRHQPLQGVPWHIMILTVIRLLHHEALVSVKDLPDMSKTGFHRLFQSALFLLDEICAPVQGQQKDIHHKTHHDDGKTGIVETDHRISIDDFKQDFQRLNQQLEQHMRNGHGNNPLSYLTSPKNDLRLTLTDMMLLVPGKKCE